MKNTIARVFNILHDGKTIGCMLKNKNLELTIEVSYATELINPKCTKIYVALNHRSNVSFIPWPTKGTVPTNDINIINTELDILKTKTNANTIEIMCQVDGKTELVGGILTFTAAEILIFTEDKKQISVDGLQKIADEY